jgi:hypothetical protein
LIFTFFLALPLVISGGCDHGQTATASENILVFEGTIEKLAPNPGIVSGVVAVYRLAKYRVTKVCKGKYDREEIVVDHLVFDRKEFEGFNVGDKVCVTAKVADKPLVRYDAEGIRDSSETIKTFYLAASNVTKVDQDKICCEAGQ